MTATILPTVPDLSLAKWCHSTRRIAQDHAVGLDPGPDTLHSGDLLLVEVMKISQHKRVQLRDGRYARLFPGDMLVLAAGDRFATDQFLGLVGVRNDRTLDLLAGGGVAGREKTRHGAIKPATRLALHGRLVARNGAALNLAHGALPPTAVSRPAKVITVVGTGMNAGKTDAVAGLVNGLTRFGCRVGAIKGTGTAAFCDTHLYRDAGAHTVLDFTDAGMAATYRQPVERIEGAIARLLAETVQTGCDVAVVELADGISQVETADLLARPAMARMTDGWVLAAADAMAAEAALARLAAHGITPLALSGLMTRSFAATDSALGPVPVLDRNTLADPATASALLQMLQTHRPAQAAE